MERLLILGGGRFQIPLIKKAVNLGYEVIVTDYLDPEEAEGKKIAHKSESVSTLDIDGVIQVGQKHNIDGIVTCSTDQPVLTAAKVTAQLNLPALISVDTAIGATNKTVMKRVFHQNHIPTPQNYSVRDISQCKKYAQKLRYPVVIKPADSQSQRGVHKIDGEKQLDALFHLSRSFSRCKEVLVEKFYESAEISFQVWVVDYTPYILIMTDRMTVSAGTQIGICIEHVFPSRYMHTYYEEARIIIRKIVNAFKIENGPLYVQMLVGKQGIKVCEFGCRIGGGNEYYTVKAVTGIDMYELLINQSLKKEIDMERLEKCTISENPNYAIMKWVVGDAGDVAKVIHMPKAQAGVAASGIFAKRGMTVEPLSGTQKLGMVLCVGKTEHEVRTNMYNAYKAIKILDKNNQNLITFLNEDQYQSLKINNFKPKHIIYTNNDDSAFFV
ncbi:MAG: ATP-grasp domain-containing protein [Firmicutes bacterium]|nr:ATP-grasp domain-containing protein [Bacillota bacterium]